MSEGPFCQICAHFIITMLIIIGKMKTFADWFKVIKFIITMLIIIGKLKTFVDWFKVIIFYNDNVNCHW